ncbi:hypothetical protein P4O66_003269 [Electrophorus voltai]|uniref:Cadherin domain-containing protein n=1 Tax=Electrophorus voltai TaxID=2609070 RepID=A0AAD8YNY2_9TELE|nr:hypothetical protein P4O66_003269 [Electrophorus voltai]
MHPALLWIQTGIWTTLPVDTKYPPDCRAGGTTVMTMTAFDADDTSTDNAVLRYNILRQQPEKPSPNMFYIDPERGNIVTVISPSLLDREAEE